MMAFDWRIYGLGVMALGMVCLALGDFHPGRPVPKDFPDRTALAYAASARIDAALASRLTRLGQVVFGVCALISAQRILSI